MGNIELHSFFIHQYKRVRCQVWQTAYYDLQQRIYKIRDSIPHRLCPCVAHTLPDYMLPWFQCSAVLGTSIILPGQASESAKLQHGWSPELVAVVVGEVQDMISWPPYKCIASIMPNPGHWLQFSFSCNISQLGSGLNTVYSPSHSGHWMDLLQAISLTYWDSTTCLTPMFLFQPSAYRTPSVPTSFSMVTEVSVYQLQSVGINYHLICEAVMMKSLSRKLWRPFSSSEAFYYSSL